VPAERAPHLHVDHRSAGAGHHVPPLDRGRQPTGRATQRRFRRARPHGRSGGRPQGGSRVRQAGGGLNVSDGYQGHHSFSIPVSKAFRASQKRMSRRRRDGRRLDGGPRGRTRRPPSGGR
jgi:hypothetical protein